MIRAILLSFILLVAALPATSGAEAISGPEVRLANNGIYVSFSLVLEADRLQEIKDGIDKELKFYVDLFRVWNVWPDEFVLGKTYIKTMKSDQIKKEYVATSFDGNTLIQKRFRSFDSMADWTFNFRDLRLTNTRELDPGLYFVRVTVESKVRKLPPVIGQFLIFISENEFRIRKDSPSFSIEGSGK